MSKTIESKLQEAELALETLRTKHQVAQQSIEGLVSTKQSLLANLEKFDKGAAEKPTLLQKARADKSMYENALRSADSNLAPAQRGYDSALANKSTYTVSLYEFTSKLGNAQYELGNATSSKASNTSNVEWYIPHIQRESQNYSNAATKKATAEQKSKALAPQLQEAQAKLDHATHIINTTNIGALDQSIASATASLHQANVHRQKISPEDYKELMDVQVKKEVKGLWGIKLDPKYVWEKQWQFNQAKYDQAVAGADTQIHAQNQEIDRCNMAKQYLAEANRDRSGYRQTAQKLTQEKKAADKEVSSYESTMKSAKQQIDGHTKARGEYIKALAKDNEDILRLNQEISQHTYQKTQQEQNITRADQEIAKYQPLVTRYSQEKYEAQSMLDQADAIINATEAELAQLPSNKDATVQQLAQVEEQIRAAEIAQQESAQELDVRTSERAGLLAEKEAYDKAVQAEVAEQAEMNTALDKLEAEDVDQIEHMEAATAALALVPEQVHDFHG